MSAEDAIAKLEFPEKRRCVITLDRSFGELSDGELIQKTESVLRELRQNPAISSLIVDCTNVPFFGSIGISFLLKAHMRVKGRGGHVILCGLSQRLKELLHLTALDTLWDCYPTPAEAQQALPETA